MGNHQFAVPQRNILLDLGFFIQDTRCRRRTRHFPNKTHPRVVLQLWISSQGAIERYELQGDAANDRAIQALIAPIMETPMRPAMIGRVPVPSTMRIELWEGEAGAPDFVGPLTPDAAKSAAQGGPPGAVR